MELATAVRGRTTRTVSALALGCLGALSALTTHCSLSLDLEGLSDSRLVPDTSVVDVAVPADGHNESAPPDLALADSSDSDDDDVVADVSAADGTHVDADTRPVDVRDAPDGFGEGDVYDVGDVIDAPTDRETSCSANLQEDPDNCGQCGHRCCLRACRNGKCESLTSVTNPQPKLIGQPRPIDEDIGSLTFGQLYAAGGSELVGLTLTVNPKRTLLASEADIRAFTFDRSVFPSQIFWSSSGGLKSSPMSLNSSIVIGSDLASCSALEFDDNNGDLYVAGCTKGPAQRAILRVPRNPPSQGSPTLAQTIVPDVDVLQLSTPTNDAHNLLYIVRNVGLYLLDGAKSTSRPVPVRSSHAPQGMGVSASGSVFAWVDPVDGEVNYYPSGGGWIPIARELKDDPPQAATTDESMVFWGTQSGYIMAHHNGDDRQPGVRIGKVGEGVPKAMAVDGQCVYVLTTPPQPSEPGKLYGFSKSGRDNNLP